jgi:urea transporter
MTNDHSPLHELLARILVPQAESWEHSGFVLPVSGTMQSLNQRLVRQPLLDFINYILRGIGQVIFLNNPLSGLLILVALLLQSPWVGILSLVGGIASTLSAIALKLDRDSIRNGIFGYNGVLVGAALGTFGLAGNGALNLLWAIAVVVFSSLTTVLMKTMGIWCASTLKAPPLTLPFNIATLLFLSLVLFVPQSLFDLGSSASTLTGSSSFDWLKLARSLPISFGQVFLADKLIPGILIGLAVAICTPIGAGVGILGSVLGLLVGLILGAAPEKLYAGLWGYNAILAAMAIGGVFYAPTRYSILIGGACGLLSAITGAVLAFMITPLGLPVLTLPFCIVTISFFLVLHHSLPSLVPVALHAVTTPEEHWQRYRAAKQVISSFRRQLKQAILGQRHFLFDDCSPALKGDLRYIFDAIDTDGSGTLSIQELASHFRDAGQVFSEQELAYLFKCIDLDDSGEIDFPEFGELILRHRSLMINYEKFVTYFLPIDANQDDVISIQEMNVALASVDESSLCADEVTFLEAQTGGKPLTWNQFIEVLLIT